MEMKQVIIIACICFLTAHGSPVQGKEGVSKDKEEVGYTEPNTTWTYSTVEEILAEITANKAEQEVDTEGHTVSKRALGCVDTGVAYGSNVGTAFADFTGTHPWPCGVDIVQIIITHRYWIYTIQVRYKTVDNVVIQKPVRGNLDGNAHYEDVINLQYGERITGTTGMVCNRTSAGTYIRQLAFMSRKQNGQKKVYGPFGMPSPSTVYESCTIFVVNGNINSIFGRASVVYREHGSDPAIGALGFYYEDESRSEQHAYYEEDSRSLQSP